MSFLRRAFPLSYFFHDYNLLARFQLKLCPKSFASLFCIDNDTSAIALESRPKRRTAVYSIFVLHTFWIGVTLLNIFGRFLNITRQGEYSIQHKVMDVAWLTFSLGNYAFKLEYFRIQEEIPHLLNQIFLLESKHQLDTG